MFRQTLLVLILVAAAWVDQVQAATTYTKEEVQQLLAEQKKELLSVMDEKIQHCAGLVASVQASSSAQSKVVVAPPSATTNGGVPSHPDSPSAGSPLPLATIFQNDVGTAPVGGTVGAGKSRAQITTSTANSKAAIQLNFPWEPRFPTQNDPSLSFSSGSITFSAPVNKAGPETKLATLDGLANSFNVTVGFDHFYVSELADPAAATGLLGQRFIEICRAAGITDAPKAQCDNDLVRRGLKASTLSPEDQKKLIQEFDALGISPSSFRLAYGANATIGQESYDIFNNSTLKKTSAERAPWSATAYLGFFPRNSSWYLGTGLSYQHEYKPKKTRTLCPASGSGSIVECQTGSFGPPDDDVSRLVFVEARHRFAGKAISLRFTHDYANGDSGVDVPVYLLGDGEGGLNGGVRLGWTNSDHFVGGVFVGSAFNLYPFGGAK